MTEFLHADLIPRKYTHKFTPYLGMSPWRDGTFMHRLSIEYGSGEDSYGVDIRLDDADLELPRKKLLERFIKPALYALEHRIANG